MDIEYKGGNCVAITVRKDLLVVDGKLSDLGLKDQAEKATVQLATKKDFIAPGGEETITLEGPGEYEAGVFSIKGIAARAHLDTEEVPKSATMYRVSTGDISVAIVGHVYPELTDEQLEELGVIDVLVVPVGGSGYTLDSHGAVSVVRKIDPKIVIPAHYNDPDTKYPVPQLDLAPFIKELGAAHETSAKLKLKPGIMSEILTVQELTRVK